MHTVLGSKKRAFVLSIYTPVSHNHAVSMPDGREGVGKCPFLSPRCHLLLYQGKVPKSCIVSFLLQSLDGLDSWMIANYFL